MNPNSIRTISELINYCQEALAADPAHMTAKEQEDRAVGIVAACLNPNREEWEAKHPQLEELLAIASNMEWGNVGDIEESWLRMRRLVDELDHQADDGQH